MIDSNRRPDEAKNHHRIGLIVPSSNVTMETEIPEMFRRRAAIAPETFTFHSSRVRMRNATSQELAAMARDSDRCAAELADARVDVMAYACVVAIMAQMLARLGIPCERWFARAIPFWGRLERAYFSVLSHEVSAVGTLVGPGFGQPETIGDDELAVIVRWIVDSRARGRRTCVRTAASNSARILSRLIDELGRADRSQRFMTETWRKRGTFRTAREAPRTSLRGKTASVHLAVGSERRSA